MALTKATFAMIANAPANIIDYGADPTGATDSTAAIQAAINSGADVVYVPDGIFDVSSQITISNPVRLFGPGTINETVLLTQTILVNAVDNVVIEQITFTGPETLSAWNAGNAAYRQAFKSFIRFDGCVGGRVVGTVSSGKRGLVYLNNCEKIAVESNLHEGFFGAIGTPATDGNWYSVINVQGGREHQISNNRAYECGSIVLLANDSSYNSVIGTTGKNIHDNFVYNSSGDYSSFVGGCFDDGIGSGVKIRGSGHTVQGFTIRNCGSASAAIALTGNGVTPDSYNANGSGTVCSGNTVVNSSSHAILIASQDGLYPRDFIVSNNTIVNHTGTSGFSAINITAEQGIVLTGNIVIKDTAAYSIAVFGPSAANEIVNCVISNNAASSTAQGMRLVNVNNSYIAGNVFSDISGGTAFEARLCDENLATGNLVNGAGDFKFSSAVGETCLGNVITVNKATIVASGVDNTVANNYT